MFAYSCRAGWCDGCGEGVPTQLHSTGRGGENVHTYSLHGDPLPTRNPLATQSVCGDPISTLSNVWGPPLHMCVGPSGTLASWGDAPSHLPCWEEFPVRRIERVPPHTPLWGSPTHLLASGPPGDSWLGMWGRVGEGHLRHAYTEWFHTFLGGRAPQTPGCGQ